MDSMLLNRSSVLAHSFVPGAELEAKVARTAVRITMQPLLANVG